AVLFFFQAEDGIRDFHVTGVQTCALPISMRRRTRPMTGVLLLHTLLITSTFASAAEPPPARRGFQAAHHLGMSFPAGKATDAAEIGRASCRERGETGGGAVRRQERDRALR